jgi:hypothetical protein
MLSLGVLALLGGCVTETVSQPVTTQGPVIDPSVQETDVLDFSKTHPTTQAINVDQLVDVHLEDADASQMHDLIGPLLFYYHAKGYFPPKLEDLLVIDPDLKFSNPRTGKHYGYDPEGRSALQIPSKIIVYDDVPMQGTDGGQTQGVRWCIFWDPPEHSWLSQTAQVRLISEGLFRTYNLPIPGVLQMQ